MTLRTVLALILATGSALALTTGAAAPENNLKYSYYYQFADKSLAQIGFKNPAELISAAVRSVAPTHGQTINLLIWNNYFYTFNDLVLL